MSAKIIPYPVPVATDEYFGGCPTCGNAEEHFNYRSNHYGACHTHRCYWGPFGSNLFSSWKDETQEDWDRNEMRFEPYAHVEAIYPPAPKEAASEGGGL
jgi:hypothetical protein